MVEWVYTILNEVPFFVSQLMVGIQPLFQAIVAILVIVGLVGLVIFVMLCFVISILYICINYIIRKLITLSMRSIKSCQEIFKNTSVYDDQYCKFI
jgi:hypothetical protein